MISNFATTASLPNSNLDNVGMEHSPLGFHVPQPWWRKRVKMSLTGSQTLACLGLPGLSGILPHHTIQLTTRWRSVGSSAPLLTWVTITYGHPPDDTTTTKKTTDCRGQGVGNQQLRRHMQPFRPSAVAPGGQAMCSMDADQSLSCYTLTASE